MSLTENHPGGPTVTGTWDDNDTALRAYRKFAGLYGNPDPDSEVIIQLLEETDGRRQILKRWTRDGEVDGPAEASAESPG